jgi:hypothetical protein
VMVARHTGSSTESKGNGFSILCDRRSRSRGSKPDIQQKPSSRGPDQEGNAGCIFVVLSFATLQSYRREFIGAGELVATLAVVAMLMIFGFKGAAGASVRRGATGTDGIDLNAFGLDPYDMHHVRRQTRGTFIRGNLGKR